MSIAAQDISAYVLKDLVRKLSPARFPGMPTALVALTGFVLGARFGRPHITGIVVTKTGTVLARANAERDPRRVLGDYSVVLRSWTRLISSADLSPRELMEAQSLFAQKVGFFGPTNS